MTSPLHPLLQDLGSPRRFAPGALVFVSGDPATGFHFIRTGEIRVYRMDGKGREVELVRTGPGDFIGEAVVFAGGTFPAFAEATFESETYFFEKNEVFSRIRRDPDTARFFLKLLARKCLVLNRRIETLSLRTVRQRLASHLLTACPREGSSRVVLDTSKGDLARLLGTIPETLSRTFSQMERDGLIEVRGREIRIPDRGRLQAEISY